MKQLFTQSVPLTIILQASVEPFDPVVMKLIYCFIPITHPLPLRSETIGYPDRISTVSGLVSGQSAVTMKHILDMLTLKHLLANCGSGLGGYRGRARSGAAVVAGD